MDIINRVKNIITKPKPEWDVIATETPDTGKIITGYVLPLAAIAAIAAFIGYAFIGIDNGFIRIKGMDWGLYSALNTLIGAIVGVFVSAFVIDALAPTFKSEKNMSRSVQLVAYSYTPMWIGGILAILPSISIIGALFGLYGLYLLYVGLPKLKKTPEENHVGYFIVSLLVIIAVYFVIGMIMSRILMPILNLSTPTINFNNFR